MNKTKIFDYGFMSLGIILQAICFLFSKDDILSFMIMQYIFWILNCIYGYYKWNC